MKIGVKVGEIMTRGYVNIDRNVNVIDCSRKMVKNKVGSVIVEKEKKLLGILTEKDIIFALSKRKDLKKTNVGQIMKRRVVTIKPDKDIYDALILMKRKKIRRLPVMNKGKIIGLITMSDILKLQPTLFDIARDYFKISEERQKVKRLRKKDDEEYYEF